MKLKLLWDEFATIKTSTTCTCAAAIEVQNDEQNVSLMLFLMGINDCYVVVRSNIVMSSPFIICDECF